MLDTDNSSDKDATRVAAGSPVVPPKRVRVSALAKELGIASKELVALLAELGEGAKTASSTLDEAQRDRIRAAREWGGPQTVALAAAPAKTRAASPAAAKAPAKARAASPAAAKAPAKARTRTRTKVQALSPVVLPEVATDVGSGGVADVVPDDVAVGAPDGVADGVADVGSVAVGAPDGAHDGAAPAHDAAAPAALFVAPEAEQPPSRRRRRASGAPAGPPPPVDADPFAPVPAVPQPFVEGPDVAAVEDVEDQTAEPEDVREAAEAEAFGAARKRRRRGRRGRGGGGAQRSADTTSDDDSDDAPDEDVASDAVDEPAVEQTPDDSAEDEGAAEGTGAARRRRRRRRTGTGPAAEVEPTEDDPPNTVVHVRQPREVTAKETKDTKDAKDDGGDGVRGVKGSTRLEARRQRRRDGRETNRRRPPILTESEFLARREAVDRVMAVRQNGDRTQIAVLEDDVLVEHYVTRASATSYVGNVYLGRVQNVLPSMEAAFIDIGKGRNGVLYAGEVNWDAAGLEGKSRAIEQALKSGDAVLVQVTKDPIGHKGARLTSQISLPGRYLVYVPGGGMTGISRRLPDTERHRLKSILKKIVPEDAGVIVRTAAEGVSEPDLIREVERLQAEWASIKKKTAKTSSAPLLVHGEPDLAIRVVRDVFNEDFKKLVVQGEDAWQTLSEYIEGVAPDLGERSARHTGDSDLFHDLRVDEQLMKALDRKVWLPSGGSLVIDRTEAMTVIDVNTGKFVGSGGNLEQTVTRNNLEAAEEIVRQLRLRDVGGIVVIDFIDMVLESNRELVLRRLTECLGRDRTKHQVAEVTSLGLVQMTRKRVGEGLLEAFSETCEVCHGRGVIIHNDPVDKSFSSATAFSSGSRVGADENGPGMPRRKPGANLEADEIAADVDPAVTLEQRTKALAAMSAIHRATHPDDDVEQNIAQLELEAVQAVLATPALDGGGLAAEEIIAAELAAEDVAAEDVMAEVVVAEPVVTQDVVSEPVVSESVVTEDVVAEPVVTEDVVAEPVVTEDVVAVPIVAVPVVTEEPMLRTATAPAVARPRRRRAASRPAGPPITADSSGH